jgi:hypothetical protein
VGDDFNSLFADVYADFLFNPINLMLEDPFRELLGAEYCAEDLRSDYLDLYCFETLTPPPPRCGMASAE